MRQLTIAVLALLVVSSACAARGAETPSILLTKHRPSLFVSFLTIIWSDALYTMRRRKSLSYRSQLSLWRIRPA